MNMRRAIIATLQDSGPATFIDLMGACCHGADDFNVNLLPGVLYQLVHDCTIGVDGGLYFVR